MRSYCEEVLCVQVKLSGQSGRKADVVWTDSGLLFTATGEQVIRWVQTQPPFTAPRRNLLYVLGHMGPVQLVCPSFSVQVEVR